MQSLAIVSLLSVIGMRSTELFASRKYGYDRICWRDALFHFNPDIAGQDLEAVFLMRKELDSSVREHVLTTEWLVSDIWVN